MLVRHHCSGERLQWALVSLRRENEASLSRSTDSSGVVVVRQAAGTYQLLVRGIGFAPARAVIELRGGYRDSVAVELHPDRLILHGDRF